MSEKFGEPWRVNEHGYVVDNTGHTISGKPTADYQARALTCVNALAGIENVEAWVKAHRELMEAVRRFYALPNWDRRVGLWLDIHNSLGEVKSALASCEAAEGRKG